MKKSIHYAYPSSDMSNKLNQGKEVYYIKVNNTLHSHYPTKEQCLKVWNKLTFEPLHHIIPSWAQPRNN